MARDDEFRRVAEEIRALARSLSRDLRDAVDQARRGGQPTSQAVRDGLKGVADDARRSMRGTWGQGWGDWGPGCRGGGRPRNPGYYGGRRSRHWTPPFPPYPPYPPGPGDPADPNQAAPAGGSPPPASRPWDRPPPGPGPWGHPGRNRAPRPPRPPRASRSPLPPVRHRWDATTVLGAIAVLFGIAWLLGAVHALHLSIEGVVALGLVFLGAAMIVTGRTDWSLSRRSWPVWLGLGLIVVLVSTSSTFGLGSAMRHVSFGNKNVAVTTNDQTVYGGFGNLTVDATGLTNGQKVTVNSVAGNVTVQLPPKAALTVNAHVLAGHVCVDGFNSSGVGAQVQRHFDGSGPTVTLDVHESFGQITVGNQGCSQ